MMKWDDTYAVPALVDPHVHLREGEVLKPLIELSIEGGASTLGPMPNTDKGLLCATHVMNYIKAARLTTPKDVPVNFIPIVQITEDTTEKDIDVCVKYGIRDAKIYPYERTTKSSKGVRHYARIIPILKYAGKRGMRIHLHPEAPSMIFENRDAEFAFLAIFQMLFEETSEERTIFIWEHGTDARCIAHWIEWAKSGRFFVTLTAHHLAANENTTYGDVQATCKPSYKTARDQIDLIGLVGKDYHWVMAGTDTAPHPKNKKHVLGPCACGAFTAPFAMQLYAHALENLFETPRGASIFVRFTSWNAMRLYNIYKAPRLINLVRREFRIPKFYTVGPWEVEPFWADRIINYSLAA